MKRSIMVAAWFAVVSVIGFAALAQTTISVLFDDGVTADLSARQAKAQTQLAEWMKADLVRVFARYAKSGYEAQLIEKQQDFKPGPDNYLLNVKITEYKSGSKAARIVVGYGAGGLTLKVHYELSDGGKKEILSKDDSVFSGREWINAARKLNENMAKDVTGKLGSK